MNFAGLIFLLICHYLTGRGLISLLRLELANVPAICFSFMTGVPLLSFAPCILQLMKIPLTDINVFIAIACLTALFGLPLLKSSLRRGMPKFILPQPYEWPFLIVIAGFIVISVWRCYYMPPYSRDMLSGPELIAEFAVREKTMINSVFNLDLSTSNNYFKSPYITSLQIMYKLLVYPFGQLWLSVLFVSFTIWIFTLLKERLHPLLAGLFMLLFIAIPELFAYTFVILYDYSNMVFFFSGFYFLARYLEKERVSELSFSIVLFGLATYIRTETLILIVMLLPLLVFHFYRKKTPLKLTAARLFAFVFVPFIFYFICINVFVRNFVPLPFDLQENVNRDLGNVSYFFTRLQDMATKLIFSEPGVDFYGIYFFIFCGILLLDILWLRRFNREALYALYGVAVVYIGLGIIGYLLPLADLSNTTKRGLFKAMPIALLYMANSAAVQRLSTFLTNWEHAVVAALPVKPAAATKPAQKRQGKKVR